MIRIWQLLRYHSENPSDKALPPYSQAPTTFLKHLFNEYASYYDAHMKEQLQTQSPLLLFEVLAPYLQQNHHQLLDLGCGTGECASLFKEKFPSQFYCTGIDVSEKMLDFANSRSIYDQLWCQSLQEFFNNSTISYDIILASDVLVYMGELNSLFKGIAKQLSFEGLFGMTVEKTTEAPWVWSISGRFAHRLDYIQQTAKQHHLRLLTCQEKAIRKEKHAWVYGYIIVLTHEWRS